MSRYSTLRPRGQSLAIVIFGPSELSYLRALKPAYRHCLVAAQSGGRWHLIDPLSNSTEITTLDALTPREIIQSFTACGCDAVPVQRRAPVRRTMSPAPFTCVEAVKRVLGIRAWHIVTPWQLRRYLGCRQGRFSNLR